MPKYATGKHAKAISDRSGMEFPYKEMVREWNGAFVHVSEFEPKQPQLEPKPLSADGVSLRHVRTDRTEPVTTVLIAENGFETYAAGSGIINVYSPGHGLTNGTTYLFRGPPTLSPGTGTPYNPNGGAAGNPVFAYATIPNFDGITGAQIGQGSGYAVTTGKYIPWRMIKKFLNWIKNIFKPEKQDPHLEMYEETAKQKKIRLKHKGDIK